MVFNPLFMLFIFIKFTQERPVESAQNVILANNNGNMMTEALNVYLKNSAVTDNMNKDVTLPRCGRPDNVIPPQVQFSKKWSKNDLTYKIRNTSELLTNLQVKRVVDDAINSWTENVNLRISESESDVADIDIYFTKQDGKLKNLGYAWPPECGEVYFDSDEEWLLNKTVPSFQNNKIIAHWLVAHELGHSLGLEHSLTMQSVMFPIYNTKVMLPSNIDINKLIDLYGQAPIFNNEVLCQNPTVDAMLFTSTKHQILIKGNQYWHFTEILQNGPYSLERLFPGLPENIDAAFSVRKTTYILKDNVFYRFKDKKKGYKKKLISAGLENVPDNIDAAFFEPNGTIHFFKGEKYYVFDTNKPMRQRLTVDGKKISENWSGVPDSIEAATYIGNDKILLIKNSKCYTVELTSKKLLQNEDCTRFFKCSKGSG